MDPKFLKPYDAQATEAPTYKKWEDSGYFNPDNLPQKDGEPFSIILPPPNVTGTLHMGSALMLAIEDIVVRYKRMQGFKTLWIPGTDSAAIATQARVEKDIQKAEGKSRHDLGRDELVRRINAYIETTKDTIIGQMRAMGASLDWSRYAYTMDEKRYNAVMTAFIKMYEAGLIYRGHKIVNWDPKGQTTISDDEIVYEERKDKFYYLKYGPFVIGTARPETKFGDKYVVMHPDDARYADFTHGQTIDLEWINGPITATIIKDESVDKDFGTGVMTITPWHSMVDFDLAEKYNLDKEQIIDFYGKLLPIAGEFAGMKITDAREKIVEKLASKGLVEKIEDYTHNVSTAERTGGTVEPQIKLQWFVDVSKKVKDGKSLKELMLEAVRSGKSSFLTERYEKQYLHWVENLRDWCISRQIWFGHRIPVWYKGNDVVCQTASPGDGWSQDEDVLDTWFSSQLWTFSTLGWPEETADLKNYHPTSLIETAYDIIPLWVCRMVLASTFLLGEAPFKTIYIHGLVRDGQGRKISKSLGNNIDPVDMAAKYGMDAVRIALIMGMAPGTDSKIDENKIRGYKNFANKIWNIARFVLENVEPFDITAPHDLSVQDKEDIAELNRAVADVTKNLDEYRIDLAADRAYHYVWHTFADEVLERSKPVLYGTDAVAQRATAWKLYLLLTTSVKLLHPFMPFVTEEIWSSLPAQVGLPQKDVDLLMVARWPTAHTLQ
jgi:valyl-tRNA synthetase